jgi:Rrf2 family protein
MSFYSRPTKMAVRILTHMAADGMEQIQTVRNVARSTQVPEPSAAKILQSLARDGILESRKGPGGGFRLSLPPDQVLLAHIVRAVEGEDFMAECVGGFKKCAGHPECPLHDKWIRVKQQMLEFLDTTTLEDMLRASQHENQLADA